MARPKFFRPFDLRGTDAPATVQATADASALLHVLSRYASYFAVIEMAASLLHAAVTLPWEFVSPIRALWNSLAEGADEANQAARALQHIYSWAQAHAMDFVGRERKGADYKPAQPSGGWAGRWDSAADWASIAFHPHKLESLLKDAGFVPVTILRTWRDRGWLDVDDDREGRLHKTVRAGTETQKLVVILRSALEQNPDALGNKNSPG